MADAAEETNGLSLDAALGARDKDRLAASEKRLTLEAHERVVVAWFITRWLIYLFVFQAGLLTIVYSIVLATYPNELHFQRTTDAAIRGMQVILPVTTTLLGVAIGYYFREESGKNLDTTGENII